jgi:hypothetical protein
LLHYIEAPVHVQLAVARPLAAATAIRNYCTSDTTMVGLLALVMLGCLAHQAAALDGGSHCKVQPCGGKNGSAMPRHRLPAYVAAPCNPVLPADDTSRQGPPLCRESSKTAVYVRARINSHDFTPKFQEGAGRLQLCICLCGTSAALGRLLRLAAYPMDSYQERNLPLHAPPTLACSTSTAVSWS